MYDMKYTKFKIVSLICIILTFEILSVLTLVLDGWLICKLIESENYIPVFIMIAVAPLFISIVVVTNIILFTELLKGIHEERDYYNC